MKKAAPKLPPLTKEVWASAQSLTRKALAPVTDNKLRRVAPKIAALEIAAADTLRLLDRAIGDQTFRLPYPGVDKVLANLRRAVRGE